MHPFASLRLAASTSKLTCRSSSFFWPVHSHPENQLFLTYGDVSGSIRLSTPPPPPPPRTGSLLAEDVFCTWTRMPHHDWSPVLGVALGDNESLHVHASHFHSRDLTKQEKTGALSFFTSSSKTIKRSSSQREVRDTGLELVTGMVRTLRIRGQTSNTHVRPRRRWQRRSSGSEATGSRVTVPCS